MVQINEAPFSGFSELEVSYVRSSGPGGQNVNKVNSKCVVRWNVIQAHSIQDSVRARFLERFSSRLTKNGDLIISSDRFRDQKRNFEDCIQKLNEMLGSVLYPPKARKKTKVSRGAKRKRVESKRLHSAKKEMRKKM